MIGSKYAAQIEECRVILHYLHNYKAYNCKAFYWILKISHQRNLQIEARLDFVSVDLRTNVTVFKPVLDSLSDSRNLKDKLSERW